MVSSLTGKAHSTKITLPKTWIDKMGITPEERVVTVTFDGEKITIAK